MSALPKTILASTRPSQLPPVATQPVRLGKLASITLATTLLASTLSPADKHIADTAVKIIKESGAVDFKAQHDPRLIALARIRSLKAYKNGWNFSHSRGATADAIEQAERFAMSLGLGRIASPYIALADDGEVNFLWNLDNFKLDLGIVGDGTYSYFGKDKNQEYYGDEIALGKPLPEEILELLSA